jgi:hypothetical protein
MVNLQNGHFFIIIARNALIFYGQSIRKYHHVFWQFAENTAERGKCGAYFAPMLDFRTNLGYNKMV